MQWMRTGVLAGLLLGAGGWQTAAAQAARSFAAVAGVGSSTFTGADITGANQVGFLVGGLADLPVTERISVRPGLVFNQKGAKDDLGSRRGHYRLNVLQIPLLAQYEFSPQGGAGLVPQLYAGPAFAFRASCRYTELGESESVPCEDRSFDASGTDLSFVFGAGVRLGHTGVSLRYDKGLSEVISGYDVKTRLVSLVVTHQIGRR